MPFTAVENCFRRSQRDEVGLGSGVIGSCQQQDTFLRVGVQVSRCRAPVDDHLTVDPEIPADVATPRGIREGSGDEEESQKSDGSKRSKEFLHSVFVTTSDTGKPAEISRDGFGVCVWAKGLSGERRPPGLEALMIWDALRGAGSAALPRWHRRLWVLACSRRRRLLAVAVVVDIASTLKRDLVARDCATLYLLRSLSLRVLGLRGSRLRDWVDIGGVNAANWSDHKGRIGRRRGIFSGLGRVGHLW
jgi:hypothetical protein